MLSRRHNQIRGRGHLPSCAPTIRDFPKGANATDEALEVLQISLTNGVERVLQSVHFSYFGKPKASLFSVILDGRPGQYGKQLYSHPCPRRTSKSRSKRGDQRGRLV